MQPLGIATSALLGLVLGLTPSGDEPELSLAECPAAVQKTLQAEAKGATVEGVTKEKDEHGRTIYWADVAIGGKTYAIGVLEDGTLAEMGLAVDDDEVPLVGCPDAVRATFRAEAFGEKVETVGRDMRRGVLVYEAVVEHKGRSYSVVVADDGTLVEKMLVIDDDEVKLERCPAAVQATLREHAQGGTINHVLRSTGIGGPTYEAEVRIKGKAYLIEVAESGLLISKALDSPEG